MEIWFYHWYLGRKNTLDKDEFSVNYGLSFIGSKYGIKLIAAAGCGNGFKSTSGKSSLLQDIYQYKSSDKEKQVEQLCTGLTIYRNKFAPFAFCCYPRVVSKKTAYSARRIFIVYVFNIKDR